MGIQNDVNFVGSVVVFSQNQKIELSYSAIAYLAIYPKILNVRIQTDIVHPYS
jgi:hypothetical protein